MPYQRVVVKIPGTALQPAETCNSYKHCPLLSSLYSQTPLSLHSFCTPSQCPTFFPIHPCYQINYQIKYCFCLLSCLVMSVKIPVLSNQQCAQADSRKMVFLPPYLDTHLHSAWLKHLPMVISTRKEAQGGLYECLIRVTDEVCSCVSLSCLPEPQQLWRCMKLTRKLPRPTKICHNYKYIVLQRIQCKLKIGKHLACMWKVLC